MKIVNAHLAMLDAIAEQRQTEAHSAMRNHELAISMHTAIYDPRSAVRISTQGWRRSLSRLKRVSSYEEFCERVADWSIEELHAERDLLRRARS
jgi:hypothetical protein